MPCGLCKQDGHNKKTCPTIKPPVHAAVTAIEPAAPPAPNPFDGLDEDVDSADVALIRALATEILEAKGAGHLESIYHAALKIGLQDAGLKFETERVIPINFRSRQIGTVRADLIVEGRLAIELKSSSGTDSAVSDAQEQCRIYMREANIPNGLVVVFPKRVGGKLIVLSA
jgi:GxxExxY protein